MKRICDGNYPVTDEYNYNKAMELSTGKCTSTQLQEEIKLFNYISGYKDADQQALKAEVFLKKVIQEEKEQEILRLEEKTDLKLVDKSDGATESSDGSAELEFYLMNGIAYAKYKEWVYKHKGWEVLESTKSEYKYMFIDPIKNPDGSISKYYFNNKKMFVDDYSLSYRTYSR